MTNENDIKIDLNGNLLQFILIRIFNKIPMLSTRKLQPQNYQFELHLSVHT